MKWRRGGLWALMVGSALSLMAMSAQANPFDTYGAGARSTAMGGAQVASGHNAMSIYDNVAGLAGAPVELRAGLFATWADTPIKLYDRPDGYDIPDLGTRTPTLPSADTREARQDTDSIDPLYGIQVGMTTDFGGTDTRGGVMVMLPTNDLLQLQSQFPDERERIYSNQLSHEVIGSRVHRPVIEFGAARQMTDRIAFGVGGTYLPGAMVGTTAYVRDPADQSDVDINLDGHTTNNWGLLTGVIVDATDDLSLGLAYRGGLDFGIEGANVIQVRGINATEEESTQELDWVPISTPSSIRGGLAWEVGSLELSLDGRYTFWSNYRNTHNEEADFNNTLEGRLGAEWRYSPDTRLRAGLGAIPSPVPEQDGRTNYVDNTRLMASVGGAHEFGVMDRTMEVSWYVQAQHLLERQTHKRAQGSYPACDPGVRVLCDEVPDDTSDPTTGEPYEEAQGLKTGNPGFPGFSSGGWLGMVGIELRY